MKSMLKCGLVSVLVLVGSAGTARADDGLNAGAFASPAGTCGDEAGRSADRWTVNWSAQAAPDVPTSLNFTLEPAATASVASDDAQTSGRKRTVAVEYSDGYKRRLKIHKIASFATLPLFVTEYWIGAYMYANPDSTLTTPSLQTAHRTVGISLGVLFGVNTVTGVWNLVEGRKDPNNRGRRMFHGITMLIADAGFALAATKRPTYPINDVNEYYSQRQTHRTIAVTSMAIATVSYLSMLFGSH